MAEFKIDSWNAVQLSRLRDFFRSSAKPGDKVIFDRKLAEENVSALEGLDDKDCNSWVYRVANMALEGMTDKDIVAISDTITLTTAYLSKHYPQDVKPAEAPVVDLWDDEGDWELDLDLKERVDVKPAAETETEEWAKVLARYNLKPEPV